MAISVNLIFFARNAIKKVIDRRDIIIVIDVLRFSSSVINAFANGAKEIIPTKTLSEAYKLRKQYPNYVLAGERKGLKPYRFDLGNSPLEFKESVIKGKKLIFTTTSGTQTLVSIKSDNWVFIGGFLNARTVGLKAYEMARKENVGICIILAGKKGAFSLEDFLGGGAIISNIPLNEINLSDIGIASLMAFKQVENSLFEIISLSEHAKELLKLGLENDIKFSCMLNCFEIAPIYRDKIIKII
ncbi:MAG: 2-phosphosulfolactate phosphatase [Candidatus Bathyarchaeia archaeon]|nr:2-phosphosulfolactate phosphatase [Candidatus Bathyarchaeota archaeon]